MSHDKRRGEGEDLSLGARLNDGEARKAPGVEAGYVAESNPPRNVLPSSPSPVV
jgi:hypothetical protein